MLLHEPRRHHATQRVADHHDGQVRIRGARVLGHRREIGRQYLDVVGQARRSLREAVTPLVGNVHDPAPLDQCLGDVVVAPRVLAVAVGQHDHEARLFGRPVVQREASPRPLEVLAASRHDGVLPRRCSGSRAREHAIASFLGNEPRRGETRDRRAPAGRTAQRLAGEDVAWLTTSGSDGQPQASPVWFIWDGASLWLRSQAHAGKIRNIEANPRVAFHLADDGHGGNILTIEGTASFETEPPSLLDAYLAKYDDAIRNALQVTPEQLAADYPITIRIMPTRTRLVTLSYGDARFGPCARVDLRRRPGSGRTHSSS